AMGRPLFVLGPRKLLFFACEIAVQIFKPQGQLIGLERLGAAAELHSLELLDDRFESLDLGLAMLDRADYITHKAMQKCRICREFVEIKLHVRFYSNVLIRRSDIALFDAGFCDSASESRLPNAFRCAPVDAFNEHGELRGCQSNRAFEARHSRPHKPALVDPLREQAKAVTVPKKNLQHRRLLAAEGKEMAR